MKKKISMLIVMFACLFFCGQTEVSARSAFTIAPTEIVLGGIGKNCTYDYIKKIYGEPTHQGHYTDSEGRASISLSYGPPSDHNWSITTKLIDGEYYVTRMTLGDKAPGISTPAGIHVGSTLREVYNAYGDYNEKFYYPSGEPAYRWTLYDKYPTSNNAYKSKHSILRIQVENGKVWRMTVIYKYDGVDLAVI